MAVEFILGEIGAWVIIIVGTLAASLCFIAYGRVRGEYVPIKRVYLVSLGAISVAVSSIFLSVLVDGAPPPLIALNRLLVLLNMVIIAKFALDILRLKNDIDKDT